MYTGREYDQEMGLYYYRARYYDPREGRFIQKDPISYNGGINVYAYVQNNPINFKDPTGLAFVADDAAAAYAAASALAAAYAAYRTNPNIKGSTPNYKKPKSPNQCSYQGPGKDTDPFLPYLIPLITLTAKGQELINNIPDFLDTQLPGTTPAAQSAGGLYGTVYNFIKPFLPHW